MSLANPLTNSAMSGGGYPTTPVGAGNAAVPNVAGNAADIQGTPPIMGPHNTPLHVATLVLLGGLTIAGLHFMGFRFTVDAGLGR